MESGGSSRGRGTGVSGSYHGRGRGRGRGRDGGRDHHQQQQPPPHLTGLGRGRSGPHWNRTNPQASPHQVTGQEGGGVRGGYAGGVRGGGGGNGGRLGWVARSQSEKPSYSHATESAGGRGGGTGGVPQGRLRRPVAGQTPEPEVDRAALPSSSTQPAPVPAVINIIEQLASTSLSPGNENRYNPIMRPDEGGKASVATVRLNVNHFRVNFNPESIIRHYDVDIKTVEPPRNGRVAKLSKLQLSTIRSKLFTDNPQLPLLMTAYDGEKNMFSAVRLPEGEFKVELSEGEDLKPGEYKCSIKLVNELKLCKLRDYLSKNDSSNPRDILQGMDVVMKENSVMHMIPVGRSFHPTKESPEDDLGYGITASRGIHYSLKPTFEGLALCLDYSILAFRKKMSVLEFLAEHIPDFNVNNFRRFRRDVDIVLKNLKVNVTHRVTKQKYVIVGLTREDTRRVSFPDANDIRKNIRIVDYFKEKYNKNITHLDIPCLDVSRNKRMNYIPMEFCVLAEGQIYPKEYLDDNAALLLKNMSLAEPRVRQSNICGMVQSEDGPCGGNIIQNFGIEVDINMTPVEGRVIEPPVLKLAAPRTGKLMKITVDKQKCQWNLVGKAVVEGKSIQCWGVIDFTRYEERARLNCRTFILKLIDRCRNLGMRLEEPLYEKAGMQILSNVNALGQLLEGVTSQVGRGNLQFLLCVMSRKDDGYKCLKWISETKIGVVTQCCLSYHANRGQDQYLANLALKINAKLGGSNVELNDRLPHFHGEGHVMFVGADVNHPGARDKTSPSIAAVVATMNWPKANRYAARVRPQLNRKEQILEFGKMCLELVESYGRLNNVKPEKIVIFRDGVSEGQFDMVLNEELMDIKNAFQKIDYFPTVSVIVAQKRHQTRFFPVREKDGGPNGNISPGTVVDTTIVHPFEFDFYLCSHHGSLGTSKPTHYHVLWDEHGFSSDQLQKLIYDMCFTFARCTKPVSLVPPVYYADLVAYRGRLYYQAMIERKSPLTSSTSSSSLTSSSSMSSAALFQDWFKLHADLENMMFFI
ncbi:Protein argonaute 2 [Hibiscus syriacus]|uniref:Protein argonaute 2 n=1 Tax=Hibiscus syriacus TaxID=106335 RepID=A0A6A3C9B2_HIBSY|nr:protein argonaute 2-like [Hibiscus syriacus]KAE8725840.1 Protein argonaute 2 [Hibiscus syriacus]